MGLTGKMHKFSLDRNIVIAADTNMARSRTTPQDADCILLIMLSKFQNKITQSWKMKIRYCSRSASNIMLYTVHMENFTPVTNSESKLIDA